MTLKEFKEKIEVWGNKHNLEVLVYEKITIWLQYWMLMHQLIWKTGYTIDFLWIISYNNIMGKIYIPSFLKVNKNNDLLK